MLMVMIIMHALMSVSKIVSARPQTTVDLWQTVYLFRPRAPLALSKTDSSLCASFSRDILSLIDWPVDFWSSGMRSLMESSVMVRR